MATLENVRMLFTYLRARLAEGRSESGILTMEVLGWVVVGLIVIPLIAGALYYGWLEFAKQSNNAPQSPAPAP
jgi:hypothetical protein